MHSPMFWRNKEITGASLKLRNDTMRRVDSVVWRVDWWGLVCIFYIKFYPKKTKFKAISTNLETI